MLWLDDTFRKSLPWEADDIMDELMAMDGEVVRRHKNRRTVRFTLGEDAYYIKTHGRTGLLEILKTFLTSLSPPVIGARPEWTAIMKFEELGIATMDLVGYASEGATPLTHRSFVITRSLENTMSLDLLCWKWLHNPPKLRAKWTVISTVASISSRMLENGINHRDFYLNHFLIDCDSIPALAEGKPPLIHLIDLHRVQIRKKTPRRWKVKDLGSLYYTSLEFGFTRKDYLRFIKAYTGMSLREALAAQGGFWKAVERRAAALYKQVYKKAPDLP